VVFLNRDGKRNLCKNCTSEPSSESTAVACTFMLYVEMWPSHHSSDDKIKIVIYCSYVSQG
jgi:hypothetical protein